MKQFLHYEKQKYVVAAIGEILWDVFPHGRQLGGAPANFIYYVHLLGGKAFIVSRVGNDPAGKEIIVELQKAGLSSGFISIDDMHPTGTISITLDKKGIPEYMIPNNVAWDYIGWNSEILELAKKADAVCYGSLAQRSEVSRNTLKNFLEKTRKGCLHVFDVNLRKPYYIKESITWLLDHSHVLKLNDKELEVLADMFHVKGNETEILNFFLNRFSLELIALTKGKNGSRLLSRHGESNHSGFSVNVIDTVGAGDSFTASLVMGLLRGESLNQLNENANKLASIVCRQSGAWVDRDSINNAQVKNTIKVKEGELG